MANQQCVIRIDEYSDRSFTVRGPTKRYRKKLKELKGRWNPNLTGGEGWIFSNTHREEVQEWLDNIIANPLRSEEDDLDIPRDLEGAPVRKRRKRVRVWDATNDLEKEIAKLQAEIKDLKSVAPEKRVASIGKYMIYCLMIGALIYSFSALSI